MLVTSLVCCSCVLLASTESFATALAAPAQYCEEDALKLLPATTPTVSGESGASVRPICSEALNALDALPYSSAGSTAILIGLVPMARVTASTSILGSVTPGAT